MQQKNIQIVTNFMIKSVSFGAFPLMQTMSFAKNLNYQHF